jgi:putative DNA primase/helicase
MHPRGIVDMSIVGANGPVRKGGGSTSPQALAVNPDGIPDFLKSLDHWVCWRYTWKPPRGKREGKWDKPPINCRTGGAASSTDCSSWSAFAEALTAYETGRYDGIGFVVHAHDEIMLEGELRPLLTVINKETGEKEQCRCDQTDGLTVIDLDKCRDPKTGDLAPWARDVIAEVDSYFEASPSGTGCRGVALGRKPAGRCKKDVLDSDGRKIGVFEIYETSRYITFTGQHLPETPATVEERHEALGLLHSHMFSADAPRGTAKKHSASAATNGHVIPSQLTDGEIIDKLSRAKNSAKFCRLMDGDTSGHGDDPSRADASLCSLIAFYTQDAAQVERLFNRSQLAIRAKWTDRSDYRATTIAKEIAFTSEHYSPRGAAIRFSSNGVKPSANGAGTEEKPPPRKTEVFTLGVLTIRPGLARRTPAGVVKVPVGVLNSGSLVADFVLSSTPSGWKGPAQLLSQLLEEDSPNDKIDKADITSLFRRIIADASQRADAPAVVEGPTVESIVKEKAPAMWQLKARTDKGAWSEAKPGEVARSEFTSHVPDDLVEECGKAADAPKQANGTSARQDLVRLIQTELLVVWSSLLRTLPARADANLGENTAAGRQFREHMVRLWTTPGTWEIPKAADGTPSERIGATKASLISRVQSQKKEWLRLGGSIAPREAWRRIHAALSGWWRVADVDGEIMVFLAMRWDLANGVRQELPGVTDQKSLNNLGKQFGVLDPAPAVSANLSGGAERLAVLSQSLTTELLAVPDDMAANPGADDQGSEVQ